MIYEIWQNNSHGVWDEDAQLGLAKTIFVEASDEVELGRYMRECIIPTSSVDCPCCGDRWHDEYPDATYETVEEAIATKSDLDCYRAVWGEGGISDSSSGMFVHNAKSASIDFRVIDRPAALAKAAPTEGGEG